jgi:hypothetical protein
LTCCSSVLLWQGLTDSQVGEQQWAKQWQDVGCPLVDYVLSDAALNHFPEEELHLIIRSLQSLEDQVAVSTDGLQLAMAGQAPVLQPQVTLVDACTQWGMR